MQYILFGKFVREKRLREHPDISLNKFAIDNDLEPAMLSRFETGKQDITYTAMEKIANGFGIMLSELIAEFEKYKSCN